MSTDPAPGMEEPLPLPQIRVNGSDADSKDVPEHLHRQQTLDAAYQAVFSKAELSKTQKKADKHLDAIDLYGISTSCTTVDNWSTANEPTLASAATTLDLLSSDAKSIDGALNSYAETYGVVIQSLEALGQVHAFISALVAVFAFKLVATIDMTRRANNKKVLVVMLQMQDMMIALCQLRHIKDPQEVVFDGTTTIKDRLGSRMETIAKDIKETAADCSHYLKKGFLEHREAIVFALQSHMALGVESANAKLDVQNKNLMSMHRKLDEIFRKLDTAREKDIWKFIETKGGPKACIDNEHLLHELVEKSGEGIAGVLGQQSDETWAKAKDKLQTAMRKELAEDVELALKRNFAEFEKKLTIQSRISDDDIRALWKDMGWKGSSVKAKHLVLALHDYFTDRLKAPTRSSSPISMMPPITYETGNPINSLITRDFSLKSKSDQWTLAYLNIAHLQPILEAVDDDASGFITIKEINTFTNIKSTPPFIKSTALTDSFRLPQWIAYWAKGWHVSVNQYKKKIRMILSEMYDTFPKVLPANREAVARYLQHRVIYKVDRLLRSTRDVSSNALDSSELRRLTEEYTNIEEARLGANLEDVRYEIDGRSTVSIITGPGRIERILQYIYPMMYLLLRHQSMVVCLSTRFVLDPYEVENMLSSLWNLFSVVEERNENLAAIFKQSNMDVAAKLENFAFGMLKLSYNNPEKQPSNNLISDYVSEDLTIEEQGTNVTDISLSILRHPLPRTSGPNVYHLPSDFSEDSLEDPIQGQWTGHLYYGRKSVVGLIQFVIDSVKGGALTGQAVTWIWDVEVTGNVKQDNKVYIRLVFDHRDIVDLVGELDIEKGIIKGRCEYIGCLGDEDSKQPPDEEAGSDQCADNSDQGGAKEDGSRDEDIEESSDNEEGGEHRSAEGNKAGEAVSEGEDTEDGTNAESSSTHQNDETCAADESHSGTVGPKSDEADVHSDDSQASDSSGSTDPEAEDHYYRFLPGDQLQRDPPAADESTKSRAQARWKFACMSVRDRINRKSFSWKFLKARFSERRRFLDLAVRERCGMNYCPRNLLSEEEKQELYRLKCSIYPMDSRYYYSLVEDEITRLITSVPTVVTLAIRAEDLVIQFWGAGCIDRSCQRDGFVHDPSHVLLKFDSIVLDGRLRRIIIAARSMVARIREEFRSSLKDRIEPVEKSGLSTNGQSRKEASSTAAPPTCRCCGKLISLPCWVCVICPMDAYVCDECDVKKKTPLSGDSHRLGEPLLRITECDPPVEVVPTEVKLASLEKKFDRVHERLAALETMLKEYFSSLTNGNILKGSD
ncbi:hypothetical protein ARMSODRAFT_1035308 [Armillaria solidipes]|uniref:EF-hand domain-containing protein n=1 Tax=Armillaria solidipes TaxID=1076256 RepID=A0A2H3BI44_9AGAR|nr:hypothetical protein ARMSODRAFT_1035308 [Armillaria solidipes]